MRKGPTIIMEWLDLNERLKTGNEEQEWRRRGLKRIELAKERLRKETVDLDLTGQIGVDHDEQDEKR